MLPTEWRWFRIVQVQSGGKVVWVGLAWNKTLNHDLYKNQIIHKQKYYIIASKQMYVYYTCKLCSKMGMWDGIFFFFSFTFYVCLI